MEAKPTQPQADTNIEHFKLLRRQDPDFAVSEGNAFDAVLGPYSTLVQDMETNLIQFIADTTRTKCRKFKKEK